MPHPELVEEVVNQVVKRTNVSFSVKMRLGLTSPNEGIELVKRLNHYPLDFVVIHPRLGIQQYDGVVDLYALENLLSISNHNMV
jgi:tRNA-dihydrouridine synthase